MVGIDPAIIRGVHGDTALTPYSTGAYASRSMVMAGGAVSRSCVLLARRIVRIGAHLMQCKPAEARLAAGRARGPPGDVARAATAKAGYLRPADCPADVDPARRAAARGLAP